MPIPSKEIETPNGSGLARKLAEVMAAVDRVPKNGRNDFHKYDYATEADIAAKVRAELAARKIAFVPQIDSFEMKDLASQGGKPKFLTILRLTFTLIDGDSGERLDRPWYGTGEDASDKGLYKAMTGAEKYFLLKLFLIPTGDDPERDNEPRPTAQAVTTPAGFDEWCADMTAAAQTGAQCFRDGWKASKVEYRTYATKVRADLMQAWKDAAAKADAHAA